MTSDGIDARREALERAFPELNPPGLPPPGLGGKCPRATVWKSSCKSRGCPYCGPRWARRQQAKIRHNLEFAGGKVATIAVTAPGADVLPWDEDYCRSRRRAGPRHTHSGRRGCRCEQRPLREWCETLPWRWKKLREAAQLATRREVGEPVWIMERVWEPQKRGAPHGHLVVPYGTPEERRVADVFREHLAALAPAYGFGRVQPKLKAISGEEAARYLASYLAGRTRKKSSIRENIADKRLPASLLWETPILSSVSSSPRMAAWRERYGIRLGTGITMRTLRRSNHLWACFEGVCEEYPVWAGLEEAVVVAAVFRRTNPKRAGPLGDVEAALTWARQVDAAQRARGGWDRSTYDPSIGRWLPNQPLYLELTRLAFVATRASGADVPSGEGSTLPVAA